MFADNFISSANPTTNYDASTNLAIGNYGGNKKRSIIQFNFNNIPKTAKITSAKLNVYFYGITGTSTSRTINCHRILPSWLKTAVTWNKRNGSTNWAVAGLGITNNDATDTLYATSVTLTTNYGWKEFRIDSLTARWIRGVYNNYGLLLRATNETTSGDEKLFYSSEYATVSMRPKLEIVYTIDPLVEYTLYDSESKPLKVTYANGMTEYNTYNAYRGWLTERKYVWTVGGSEISKVQNDVIDLVGNITHQNATHTPVSSKQYTYQYDSLYRLTSFQDGATTIKSYTYDRNGNFLNMTGYTTAFDSPTTNSPNNRLTCNGKPVGDTTRIVYAYDTSGRVNNVSRYVSGTLTNFPITYDAFNNMRTYSSESYLYDYEGVRTKKANGSTTTFYITNGLTVYAEYDGSNNCLNEYVYGLNGMVAALNPAKGYSWFTKDHLGNTRDVVDNGSSALMRDYCPFGQDYVAAGSVTNYLFTGKEVDNYSRLYYFGARYYDPAMGRFLSIDPHSSKYPSLTPYHYCGNNPLSVIDPTGMDSIQAIDMNIIINVTHNNFMGEHDVCALSVDESYTSYMFNQGVVPDPALHTSNANEAGHNMLNDPEHWKLSTAEEASRAANDGNFACAVEITGEPGTPGGHIDQIGAGQNYQPSSFRINPPAIGNSPTALKYEWNVSGRISYSFSSENRPTHYFIYIGASARPQLPTVIVTADRIK